MEEDPSESNLKDGGEESYYKNNNNDDKNENYRTPNMSTGGIYINNLIIFFIL